MEVSVNTTTGFQMVNLNALSLSGELAELSEQVEEQLVELDCEVTVGATGKIYEIYVNPATRAVYGLLETENGELTSYQAGLVVDGYQLSTDTEYTLGNSDANFLQITDAYGNVIAMNDGTFLSGVGISLSGDETSFTMKDMSSLFTDGGISTEITEKCGHGAGTAVRAGLCDHGWNKLLPLVL
ncbi:MAG: hypothetical protein LUC50_02360 [Ruminococcus sp.]|nr:hypothetical protein [Ruminococcus sp.]